ncbi:MAG TPA: hypothetical protein VFT64_10985 [Rickettsiales bacterium]|nr:hypothetical protein [Rickettsiales bacterium]
MDKGALLVASAVSAMAGAVTLHTTARRFATNALRDQGAFDAVERKAGENVATGQWTEREAKKELRSEESAIVKDHHANMFSGAWRQITHNEKEKSLALSAVTSVAAGVLTYAIAKRGGSRDDWVDDFLLFDALDFGFGHW